MNKRMILLLLFLSCAPVWAARQNFLTTVSPQLKLLMQDHPAAFKTLTNALTESFSNRTVRLYYFYSEDEAEAKASHFYPNQAGGPDVVLAIQENQKTWDEYICLHFEIINCQGEKRFARILEKARDGTIGRTQFAREILKIEHDATKLTRDLILKFGLKKEDTFLSDYYRKFAECPDDFEESLAYARKASPKRNALKDYEASYDAFRKAQKEYEAQSEKPGKTP